MCAYIHLVVLRRERVTTGNLRYMSYYEAMRNMNSFNSGE